MTHVPHGARALDHRIATMASLLLAACGGDDATTAIPLDELAAEIEAARCDQWVACGAALDAETCLGTVDDGLRTLHVSAADVAATRAGRILYHADRAVECVALLRDAPCGMVESIEQAPRIDSACGAILEGTLADGESCSTSRECVSGHCQAPECEEACCPGVCEAPAAIEVLDLGEECDVGPGECADGTTCRSSGVWTYTCQRLAGEAEACMDVGDCAFELDCVSATPGEAGLCTRPPRSGEDCGGERMFGCDDPRDTCDLETLRCVPRAGLGEPCEGEVWGGDDGCVLYGMCAGTTCVPRPTAGEACDDNCLGDQLCGDDGVCEPPRGPREICER